MRLDPRSTGDALAASAPELARAWRAARAARRPKVFPGLLDGLVEPLFALAAELLVEGRRPALLWPASAGVVRLDVRDPERGREELEAEWDLVEQVLVSACRSLDADRDTSAWISQAVAAARAGARRLPGRDGAPGILAVRVFSGFGPRRRVRASAPR